MKRPKTTINRICALCAVIFSCGIIAVMAPSAQAEEEVYSAAELSDQVSELKSEKSSLVGEKKEVDAQIDELASQAEAIKADNSKYRKNTDEALVTLYKMGNSQGSLIDMILSADSLEEAIDLWEYCDNIVTRCHSKLEEAHSAITSVEAEKASYEKRSNELEGKIAVLEDEIDDAQDALATREAEIEALLDAADNEGLARLSCSLAYSQKVRNSDGYPATAAYKKAWEYVLPGDSIPCGRSCDRGVMIPIRLAGIDDEFPTVCTSQFSYMQSSDRWIDLGVWDGTENGLKPGDVLVSIAGIDGASYDHSAMYVGYDIAQEMYDKVIKGTDGDLGRPDRSAVFSSASYQWGSARGRALCICVDGEVGSHVFRCVKPQNSDTYKGFSR